jgi:hypothetical protein
MIEINKMNTEYSHYIMSLAANKGTIKTIFKYAIEESVKVFKKIKIQRYFTCCLLKKFRKNC